MHVERAFVVCVYFVLAAHGDTRTGNRCIEGMSGTFTIQLQCSAGERIHVEQEAYGEGDAATCRLKSAESCSKVHNSSQNGLIVICNGKQSCSEVVSASSLNCNFTDAAAEVKYNCIKGSKDMCSTGNDSTAVNGSVYLHSPGFPYSVPVNRSCVVRITGENIQVTLVEERMKAGLLNISGDGKQLWTNVNVNQNNRVLPETAAEVIIVYDNQYQNESNVWIRVAASGRMNITSNGLISDASTTPVPMSTHQPSISQDTTSETTATTASTPPTTIESMANEGTTLSTTTSTTASDGSDPDNMANMNTTLSTTTSTTASDGSDPETVIWIASAASGCVILILIVVIAVVLCRCHRVKNSGSPVAPGSGSFERSFELTHSQNETSNMYFVLDPELVAGSGERILHTESRHKTENYKIPVQDQYSDVLPRSSRVNMYDNSTFTVTTSTADIGAPQLLKDSVASTAYNDHRALCDMTENDTYDGGVASKDVTGDGMVDNGHNGKLYDREDGYVQGESDASPSNMKPIRKEKADMIDNDVYDGGPPPYNDPVGSMDDNRNHDSRRLSTEKSHMTEQDLHDGGLDMGDDTGGGMVDNELYDKCRHDRERDSIQDASDDSPSNVFDKNVQDDKESVMVSNGLYHSFK